MKFRTKTNLDKGLLPEKKEFTELAALGSNRAIPLDPTMFRSPYDPREGVWAVYSYNDGPPEVKSVHPNPIAAIKAHDFGDSICWWPFNLGLREAIVKWREEIAVGRVMSGEATVNKIREEQGFRSANPEMKETGDGSTTD